MKKVIFLTFTIYLACFVAIAEQVDQVHCTQVSSQQFKVLSLLATVKNNILGTVPQFCREGGFFQLKDKVNKEEAELSKFVKELKNLNPEAEDALPFKKAISNAVIFKTVKMMVLKKMWQNSSEENQYKILLSSECESLELNKIPMSKVGAVSTSKEKNSEKSFIETRQICRVQKFAELGPYLTQDVIAETLLNLKTVFPKSFPKIVDSFCSKLEDTDELILKSDSYENFASGDLSVASANEHAGWLKDVYSKVDLEKSGGNLTLNSSIMAKYQGRDSAAISHLSSEELSTVKDYTEVMYRDLNVCLREDVCNNEYKTYASNLTSSINKINKNTQGNREIKVVYRGVEYLPSEITSALEKSPKDFVLDKGFMSASGDVRVAKRFAKLHVIPEGGKNALFILKTKSCAGISSISHYESEDEFLCPSGMKFNVKIQNENPRIYLMEEVGIK